MSTESPGRVPLPPLVGTLTHDNLRSALVKDARAVQLYAVFAQIAEIEGFPDLARLMREIGEGEALVAAGHMDFLMSAGDPVSDKPIGETRNNVEALLAGLVPDAEEVYPDMARTAHGEGFPDIASWFETLAHARRAQIARLQALGTPG